MFLVPTPSAAQDATIEGRILDRRTLAPVSGATVIIRELGATASAAGGRFRFVDVAPGRYRIEVEHPRYAPLSEIVTVSGAGRVNVEIALSIRATELGEILVRGRRGSSSATASGPTATLTRSDFAMLPDNRVLGDIVNRLPGVFMRGPVGVNRDIKLRGMDKGFNRFVLDGVQLPGLSSERTFQPSRLSPFSVQNLRVLRNAGAEFESDGIAGRIAAESRPQPSGQRLEMRGLVGGLDGLGGESRQLDVAVGQRLSESLGYNFFLHVGRQPREKVKTKETLDEAGDFVSFEREDEQVADDQLNLQGDIQWVRGRNEMSVRPLWLESSGLKTKTKQTDNGGGDVRLEDETEVWSNDTQGATIAFTREVSDALHWSSDVAYHRTTEESSKSKDRFRDRGAGLAPDRTENEIRSLENEAWQGNTRLSAAFGRRTRHEFSIGGQVRLQRFVTDKIKDQRSPDGTVQDRTGPADAFSHEERYLAGFVQDDVRFGERFSLVPGIRVEWVRSDAAASDGTVRTSDVVDVNPSVNARWNLHGPWSLEAAVSRKLARPKADDLIPFVEERGPRFVEGNPDLDPARAWTYDAGVRFERPGVNLALFVFHKFVNDLVGEVPTGEVRDGKDVMRPQNVGRGWIQGIELEQRIGLRGLHPALRGLTLWANESFFRSEVNDRALGLTRPFDEQRDAIVNVGIDYLAPGGFGVSLAGKYLGGLVKVKGPDEREVEDARFLVDIGVRQTLGNGSVELLFDVVNVFDPAQDKTLFKGSNRTLDSETPGTLFQFGIRSRF